MSIYFSGTFTRSAGLLSAITKQVNQINLKSVKKIQVQFDPFHPNAVTARNFLYYISIPKVQETNLNCILKTNVVCDRSEPTIKVDLTDSGETVQFLANNLSLLEVLQYFNKHISSKAKVDETTTSQVQTTKQARRRK
ncbi:large ribosomal subunit protein mL53 [Cylas formicarius]|uniref:large ribosomal subunit protein mL53 n=1 Tax=Cylas formicarius TaxID=197179 RepID=UPI002958AAC2|nr:large ribosomal subunit protein mL53 [Cylas formicarius]XP_060531229.1 large ribosomal subunit protein mL53 [Cylas formicarius]